MKTTATFVAFLALLFVGCGTSKATKDERLVEYLQTELTVKQAELDACKKAQTGSGMVSQFQADLTGIKSELAGMKNYFALEKQRLADEERKLTERKGALDQRDEELKAQKKRQEEWNKGKLVDFENEFRILEAEWGKVVNAMDALEETMKKVEEELTNATKEGSSLAGRDKIRKQQVAFVNHQRSFNTARQQAQAIFAQRMAHLRSLMPR